MKVISCLSVFVVSKKAVGHVTWALLKLLPNKYCQQNKKKCLVNRGMNSYLGGSGSFLHSVCFFFLTSGSCIFSLKKELLK